MKKVVLMLCTLLVCCCLSVNAAETDKVEACEALSNNEQVCAINKEGKCECTDISVNPTKVEKQDNND